MSILRPMAEYCQNNTILHSESMSHIQDAQYLIFYGCSITIQYMNIHTNGSNYSTYAGTGGVYHIYTTLLVV